MPRELPGTREKREYRFDARGEDGTLPAEFILVCRVTPQHQDGRKPDGWADTGPGRREVLTEGLTRRQLEALIADAVGWLAFNGTD